MAQGQPFSNGLPTPPSDDDFLIIRQGNLKATLFTEHFPDGHIDFCYVVEDLTRPGNHHFTVSGEMDNFEAAHLMALHHMHIMTIRARNQIGRGN